MEILFGALVIAAAVLTGFWLTSRRRANDQAVTQAVKVELQPLFQLNEERVQRLTEAGSSDLQAKKGLIDQQLQAMQGELTKVSELMRGLERDREGKFGELTTQLKAIGEQTSALTTTTQGLREALANSRARGQWGERMAEDILRLVGMVEGLNYRKQATVEGGRSRPDFTFFLPQGLTVNMDVKFPLDNYLKSLEAESEADQARYQADFLRDVRARISEVSTRDYIDPNQGTVDYVLLFIPNESVYAFIHSQDPGVLDEALRQKVIWCSPLTLYAMLAIIRQAVDNFALQRASEEIIGLFGRFNNEWSKFNKSLETLGTRISSAQTAYDAVIGTRRRVLERPLSEIESLRLRRGIPIADVEVGEEPELPPGEEETMPFPALLPAEEEQP
jgi:DNA recombination protein RmuC